MEFDCGFEGVCALRMAGGLMCHRTAHSLGGNRWLAAAEADRQTDSAGISTGIWESKRHVDQAALYQTSMGCGSTIKVHKREAVGTKAGVQQHK